MDEDLDGECSDVGLQPRATGWRQRALGVTSFCFPSAPSGRMPSSGKTNRILSRAHLYNGPSPPTCHAMSKIVELADRVERLLLRHAELQRTNALLEQQVATVSQERDHLRARLNAARSRIDALLDRLPTDALATTPASTALDGEDLKP